MSQLGRCRCRHVPAVLQGGAGQELPACCAACIRADQRTCASRGSRKGCLSWLRSCQLHQLRRQRQLLHHQSLVGSGGCLAPCLRPCPRPPPAGSPPRPARCAPGGCPEGSLLRHPPGRAHDSQDSSTSSVPSLLVSAGLLLCIGSHASPAQAAAQAACALQQLVQAPAGAPALPGAERRRRASERCL